MPARERDLAGVFKFFERDLACICFRVAHRLRWAGLTLVFLVFGTWRHLCLWVCGCRRVNLASMSINL